MACCIAAAVHLEVVIGSTSVPPIGCSPSLLDSLMNTALAARAPPQHTSNYIHIPGTGTTGDDDAPAKQGGRPLIAIGALEDELT